MFVSGYDEVDARVVHGCFLEGETDIVVEDFLNGSLKIGDFLGSLVPLD
jgi:hypothetical protein